jgi:hypothetical protein
LFPRPQSTLVHLKRYLVCGKDGAGTGLEIAADMGVAD